MFENIGGKIKTLAVTVTVLGIIGSVIMGILLIDEEMITAGILLICFGSLFSWISSFVLYGFGELIEHTQKIERNTSCLSKWGTNIMKPQENRSINSTNSKSDGFTSESQKEGQAIPITRVQTKKIEPVQECDPERDKETLYQFAVEQIAKKNYEFASNALKRVRGYKDSEKLLKQIEDTL